MRLWLQDFRYAYRALRKNVVLTLVIVASLAIGIGDNSAIFSVVDALLLRPLPYPHPDRLAAVWLHSPGIGILRDWPSPGQYIDIQNQNHSFEQMALAQSRTFTLTGRDQPERVDVLRAQSSLLTMFGAKALLGRLLLPEEDRPGNAPVAILSNRVWQRLFNADPAIVGRSITLDVLAAQIALTGPDDQYPARQAAFFKQLIEKLRDIPGVESSDANTCLPLGRMRPTPGR
jgi:putative ABC transport system permease protein